MASSTRTAYRLGGASLAALGIALVALGYPVRGPTLRTTATAFLSTDRPGITAHNSPAVAVDPKRPLVMAMADKIDTPTISCTLSVSANGGDTWTPLDPVPPEPGTQCFWPDVAYDESGDLLVLFTAMKDRFNQSMGVWLQRYRGGQLAGQPTRVAGADAFHARLAVTGDRVLAAWVQSSTATPFQPLGLAPGDNPIVLAASEDGGRTFAPPVTVSAPGQLVLQPTVIVGKEGEVVVGALDLGRDLLDYESRHEGQGGDPYDGRWQVVTWTSLDGGRTFGDASVVSEVVPPQRIYVDVGSPTPGFALDPNTGRLYATWDSGRGDGRDVYVSWSDDAGATWGPATQFTRDGSQTLPAVGVAADGRVDLLFYDRSVDPGDVMTVPVLASSWDRGRTFTSRAVSTRTFDSRIGFGSFQGLPSLGQQLAVISEPERALAFWTDTRKGSMDTNAQELALAHVDVEKQRGRRWPLVAMGAAMALAGAALAVLGGRQSPGTRPNRR